METLDLLYGKKYERNGEQKTEWIKCGLLFIKGDGKYSVKLQAIPMGVQPGDVFLTAQPQRERAG
jgi:hypothetical protein